MAGFENLVDFLKEEEIVAIILMNKKENRPATSAEISELGITGEMSIDFISSSKSGEVWIDVDSKSGYELIDPEISKDIIYTGSDPDIETIKKRIVENGIGLE